jgi:AraC family transcriptional regulator
MSKPILRDSSQADRPAASKVDQGIPPDADRRAADVEMARVLKTAPLRMASDPSSGTIAHRKK